jgi:hypothetical protein
MCSNPQVQKDIKSIKCELLPFLIEHQFSSTPVPGQPVLQEEEDDVFRRGGGCVLSLGCVLLLECAECVLLLEYAESVLLLDVFSCSNEFSY